MNTQQNDNTGPPLVWTLINVAFMVSVAMLLLLFVSACFGATPQSTNRARAAAAAQLALLKLRHEHEAQKPIPAPPIDNSGRRRGTASSIEIRVPEPIALQPVKPKQRLKYLTRLMVFTSRFCKPCRDQDATILRLEQSGTGWFRGPDDTYPIQIVDVDRQPDLTAAYSVEMWPTTIGIVNGREKRRRVGYISSHIELSRMLNDDSPPAAPVKENRQTSPVRGVMAWAFTVPSQLWGVGNDTKAEFIEHLLQSHNTVGFTREQLEGMTVEQLRGLHSAAHEGTLRKIDSHNDRDSIRAY